MIEPTEEWGEKLQYAVLLALKRAAYCNLNNNLFGFQTSILDPIRLWA